jgi:hypothetical protein
MKQLAMRLALAVVALAGFSTPDADAAPTRIARGADRVALIVGNNVGHDRRRSLRYAEDEVARLGELLERAGDFRDVEVLRAQSRSEVEAALVNVRRRLEAAKRAGRETLFLFYYSGHANGEALELGPTRLPLRDLRTYLEQMPADVRLGFIDACQSGALTGVKGGRRAPGYEVRLADTTNVKGLAIVTSSTASEFSQESDDLRGSYFSHNLMAGLQGLADSSGDGRITLSELYHFAYRRTLAGTAVSPIGGQHPTYVYQMSGTGDVVLTKTRSADARLRFAPEAGATYTVFDADDVVAEVVPNQSEAYYLALPAGNYRLVRRALAHLSEHTLRLKAGGAVLVRANEFSTMSNNVALARKGSGRVGDTAEGTLQAGAGDETETQTAVVPARNHVTLGLGAQSEILQGAGATAAASLAYSRLIGPRLSLRLRGDVSRFDVTPEGTAASEFLRVVPAVELLGNLLAPGRLSFHIGPVLGAPVVRQTSAGAPTRLSYGVQYGATATLAFAFGSEGDKLIGLSVLGGGETFKLDGLRQHRTTAGASAFAGLAF